MLDRRELLRSQPLCLQIHPLPCSLPYAKVRGATYDLVDNRTCKALRKAREYTPCYKECTYIRNQNERLYTLNRRPYITLPYKVGYRVGGVD